MQEERGINLWLIILLVSLISCQKKNKEFYQNGSLHFEVEVANGLNEGKMTEYYEDGSIKSHSFWVHGKMHGEVIFYDKSGHIEQVDRYKYGVRCCKSETFLEGKLTQIQFFDSLGRPYDFVKYINDKQSNAPRARVPIILAKSDTIDQDEVYVATIRLGNRVFQNTKAYVSRKLPPDLLKETPLPNIDSVTSILILKDHKEGQNIIEGMITEVNTNYPDSILVIPFSKTYFVRSFTKGI
ncbi:MAG: hypothetical protein BroJett042_02540 [Bacteroidota bacterium]|nr:MAG: hypothetical protein BroJett042_02540 [Bacteroidota bacterium]